MPNINQVTSQVNSASHDLTEFRILVIQISEPQRFYDGDSQSVQCEQPICFKIIKEVARDVVISARVDKIVKVSSLTLFQSSSTDIDIFPASATMIAFIKSKRSLKLVDFMKNVSPVKTLKQLKTLPVENCDAEPCSPEKMNAPREYKNPQIETAPGKNISTTIIWQGSHAKASRLHR